MVGLTMATIGYYGEVMATHDSVLARLDPERRAAVVLALIGLCLLGLLMVVLTMLAGRWVRGMSVHPTRGVRALRGATRKASVLRVVPKPPSASDTLPGLPPGGETTPDS